MLPGTVSLRHHWIEEVCRARRQRQQRCRVGLLTGRALRDLIREAMPRHAAQTLLEGAARASVTGARQLSIGEIQTEVAAARRERRSKVRARTKTSC